MRHRGVVVSGYSTVDYIWSASSAVHSGQTTMLVGEADPQPQFGGCGPNVALELARLGRRVSLVSWLGGDQVGLDYHAHLLQSGVSMDHVMIDPSMPTPRTILVCDPMGRASCFYHPSGSNQLRLTDEAARHVGSADALVLTVGPPELTHQLLRSRATNALLFWNVKADPTSYPSALRRQLIQDANVISANEEEVLFLAEALERRPRRLRDVRTCVRELLRVTAATIIVTAGAAGAWSYNGGRIHTARPAQIARANPVGAGDAFTAAVVDGLLDGLRPVAAMHRAVEHASRFLMRRQVECTG